MMSGMVMNTTSPKADICAKTGCWRMRLAGRIGHDAEDDLPLTAERRQIALRQHRSQTVSQEVVDVFSPHTMQPSVKISEPGYRAR